MYAKDLHSALRECNVDKRAIREWKENLSQDADN